MFIVTTRTNNVRLRQERNVAPLKGLSMEKDSGVYKHLVPTGR